MKRTTRIRAWRPLAGWSALAGLLVLSACAGTPSPIFGPPDPSLRWPPPPAPPRLQWIGELSTADDLKPGTSTFDAIGDFLFGADLPSGLVGPRNVVLTPDARHVWVTDPGSHTLHGLDLETREHLRVTQLGEDALRSPVGVCLGPPGTLFLCDSAAGTIWLVDATSGELLQKLRLPVEVFRPVALAWDEAESELFVVDSQAHDLKVLAPDGTLRRVLGHRGTAPGTFNFPCDICRHGDRIWIADAGNQRVQAIDRYGHPLISIGQAGDAPGDFALPKAVAVDADGHLYVVDGRFENVQVFDADGHLLLAFGEEGSGPGQFWLPGGIHVDSSSRVWLCDGYNRRLQVFEYLSDRSHPTGTEEPLPPIKEESP